MSVLDYKVSDHIGVVTLNRPEAKNAINPELAVKLADLWESIRDDDSIRVVVLTGIGDVFCAGADLGQLIPLMSGGRESRELLVGRAK